MINILLTIILIMALLVFFNSYINNDMREIVNNSLKSINKIAKFFNAGIDTSSNIASDINKTSEFITSGADISSYIL